MGSRDNKEKKGEENIAAAERNASADGKDSNSVGRKRFLPCCLLGREKKKGAFVTFVNGAEDWEGSDDDEERDGS